MADTDWMVDAIVGIPAAVTRLGRLSNQGIAVSIVSWGEVFEGAFGSRAPEATLAHYRRFLSDYPPYPLTDPIMTVFARTRAGLRGRGLLIPDLDPLIAATALAHDLTLLTRNRRHFDRIPGLKIDQET